MNDERSAALITAHHECRGEFSAMIARYFTQHPYFLSDEIRLKAELEALQTLMLHILRILDSLDAGVRRERGSDDAA